jgi:hypothetical protein
MHMAAIHPLTPGSPAYALAKVGAIGSLFAIRMFFSRRDRAAAEKEQPVEEPAAPAKPHPVSARKARRRRHR